MATSPATERPTAAATVPATGTAAAPAVLGAAGALALQRAAGNAALGRVLARRHPDLVDPFAEEDVDVEEVRGSILEPLERSDGMLFLSRLRALDAAQREVLERDAGFWEVIRRRFRGMALWSVQLTVRYGARKPHEVNAMVPAVHAGEWRRTRDLLMAYPSLKRVPGIREAIASQFSGEQADDLRQALAEPDGARADSGVVGGKRVHYEDGVLEDYVGQGAFELVRMRTHVRVIVRIRLYEDPGNAERVISDESVAKWERGIHRYWNGKFRLRSGHQRLDVYFLPVFVYWDEGAHHQVRVRPGNARSSMRKWHAGQSAETAAHEFGHMLGNPDEYNLPGSMAEIPDELGLTDAEKRRSSWEGLTGERRETNTEGYDISGLMGAKSRSTAVEVRHAEHVAEVFNAKLRKPGEAPWTVEKR